MTKKLKEYRINTSQHPGWLLIREEAKPNREKEIIKDQDALTIVNIWVVNFNAIKEFNNCEVLQDRPLVLKGKNTRMSETSEVYESQWFFKVIDFKTYSKFEAMIENDGFLGTDNNTIQKRIDDLWDKYEDLNINIFKH